MTEIIQFTPKKALSAQLNLQDLITLSCDHIVTWADLPGFEWNKNYWPTTAKGIKFTNHENLALHASKTPERDQLMTPEFTEFTKAYLCYRHTIKPHRNVAREIQALRALEIVLRRDLGVPDISMVNQRHFDQAVSELAVYKAHAFIVGELLCILKTLADFHIVTSNCHYWKNPLVGNNSYAFANGERADPDIKENKLPNQDALLAVAEVFGRGNTEALDDVDTMVTSITCLLLSAPMRIGSLVCS